MTRRPPRSTRSDILFPYTARVRPVAQGAHLFENLIALVEQLRAAGRARRGAAQPVVDARETGGEIVERRHRVARGRIEIAAELAELRRGALEGIGEPRRSEEHTSELQSLMRISYAVFCLKKKKTTY